MNMNLDIPHIIGIITLLSLILGIIKGFSLLIQKGSNILETVEGNRQSVDDLTSQLESSLIAINATLDILSKTIRDLDRQHIIDLTNEIFTRGYITEEEIYCLSNLYEDYKSLGGNKTIDIRYEKVMKFPVKSGITDKLLNS